MILLMFVLFKNTESNEPTSNTGISSNKHVEIYIGELSPSKNLHFEISKNTNKLYLIGGNKEAKVRILKSVIIFYSWKVTQFYQIMLMSKQ